MKRWILGVSALATIATPVAAVVSCGTKSIAQSSNDNKWKNTAAELEKIVKDLVDKIKTLEAKAEKSDEEHKALEAAKQSLTDAKEQLAKLNADSLITIKRQFDAKLAPLTTNLERSDHDALISSLQPKVEHDAEGYVASRVATQLEKELEAGFANGKFMVTDLDSAGAGVETIQNVNNWMALTVGGIHPIEDKNQHNAEDHVTHQLDDSFFTKSTSEKVAFLEDLIFGKFEHKERNGGLVALGNLGDANIGGDILASSNGITSVLYSIDESTKTLSVWTKGRIQATLPTLDELIKSKNPNWKQDQNIVSEMAKVGIAADEKITPEKYLQIIKYFYVPNSEAAAKLFAKAHPWMDGYKVDGDAEGFNVTQKMTSALAWDFDDYTMNNLGLGSKQVIKKDGSVKRFDDQDFYTTSSADQYDASVWADQFETYNGKITSKAWVFDHIFNGHTSLDGVNDWNNGGADRYHGYYDRVASSIKFMKGTYGLYVTTHVSPTNPSDQILNLIVQYKPTMKVVLRDSITLKGMQPDVSHMWDGKPDEFFNNQDMITKTDATREITTKEFMDSLVKAQAALRGFSRMALHYLNDDFIGKVIDAVATINMSTITDETAKIILGLLAERKDINLNWFISTVNKPASYIQGILLARRNNHYALSLKALQFDNILNTLIDIAKVVSPESFTKGDLAHI